MSIADQRNAALERANDVRLGVAALRREIALLDLAAGCDRVADLIERNDATVSAARVGRIVSSISRVGAAKSSQILKGADIRSLDMHVRDLTDRRRRLLVVELRRAAVRARRVRRKTMRHA